MERNLYKLYSTVVTEKKYARSVQVGRDKFTEKKYLIAQESTNYSEKEAVLNCTEQCTLHSRH